MTAQQLLEQWQSLDFEEQQRVLAFVDSINRTKKPTKQISALGQKLRKIRQDIIESDLPLLTSEKIEQEKAERRGGYVD